MFPVYEEKWIQKAIAELCYSQHGGSGFSFTPRDVLEMDIADIDFYLEWLTDRRGAEARKIEQASKKK